MGLLNLLGCEDRGPADPSTPLDPPGGGTALVLIDAVLGAGRAPCAEVTVGAMTAAVCSGDSLVVAGISELVEVRISGAEVLPYVDHVSAGDTVAVWLLSREHGAALDYLAELVNVSGSRPFPFGLPSLPIPVELDGLDTARRDDFQDVLERIGSAVSAHTGRETFVVVPELGGRGLRAATAELPEGDGRSSAEAFTEGHKLVCRIELDPDLAPGPGLSARIAHEIGHCLGLTRHDPLDAPDRVMHRLAPADYWIRWSGLSDLDALVFALAVRAAEEEIHLAGFR